ncbi:MAG: DUF2092 domain-containing protein [Planctomycetota bacterium]|nr:DUF2092 domain-containing protein [Planctomycetota bacterium]
MTPMNPMNPTTSRASTFPFRTRCALAAIAVATVLTPRALGSAFVDEEVGGSAKETFNGGALLKASQNYLRSLSELDVMVETSVVTKNAQVAAPPKRSALAYSRESAKRPLRFSVHSWSGPSGGSDLVCDGHFLLVGDPLLRQFDLRVAPPDFRTMLTNRDLSIRLGLGAAFLFSAMSEHTFADLTTVGDARFVDVAGIEAAVLNCRSTDPDHPQRVELTVATEGDPILLEVRMPLADGNTISMAFSHWIRDAAADPHDGRPRFSMTPPPNWMQVASLTEIAKTGEARAPVEALIGRQAPRMAMRDAEGNMVDPLTDMTVPVALLFTADDALNDLASQDFARLIEGDSRFRGYRVQLTSEEHALPNADHDLTVDAAKCGANWRLSGLPTLVIISPDGRIRAAQVGHPGILTWSARLMPLFDRLATVPLDEE